MDYFKRCRCCGAELPVYVGMISNGYAIANFTFYAESGDKSGSTIVGDYYYCEECANAAIAFLELRKNIALPMQGRDTNTPYSAFKKWMNENLNDEED